MFSREWQALLGSFSVSRALDKRSLPNEINRADKSALQGVYDAWRTTDPKPWPRGQFRLLEQLVVTLIPDSGAPVSREAEVVAIIDEAEAAPRRRRYSPRRSALTVSSKRTLSVVRSRYCGSG